MALRAALFIIPALIAGGATVYNRDRDRQRADPRLLDRACELSSCYPATGNLLIGREARLSASSTCGGSGRERYCIVSHLEERKKCFWCDSTNSTINSPSLNHRIQNIIYKYYPGTRVKSWWQSENGKENVTIQLDMEAEFHLTHLIIQFKTFRPAAMLVERSFDFGKTWRVYRYFAHNCYEAFPSIPRHTQRSLTEVVCESRYSGVAPSTEGEVIFRVLPPNINVTNPYSEEVQNLLRMTNLRINFTKLHTLGDDLLDNRAEIQEKYYYSIYEMTVRGSCSCYGHASRCLPMPGVESKNNMVHGRCECTHNTRGLNCEYCEEFYNDLPWQPAVGKTSNACKRCTCNNHATTCHFDAAVYNKTGKISGGVCDNCQHNTMGVNCERCKPTFYKDPSLDIQSPNICQPCDCDPEGTTDKEVLCDDETDVVNNKTAGRCLCKTNVDGLRCDRCKDGYWNFDAQNPEGCEACTCDSLGTIDERGCDPATGVCFCKRHVTGRNCDQCLPEFYGLSDSDDGCSSCDCDLGGSIDRDCDVITGQCKCRPNVTGRRCDQPLQNYFVGALDSIVYEAESSQCNSQIDDNAIQSQLCHVVIRENYPDGRKETWSGPGFMKVPESSTLVFVINNLKTSMNYNVLIRYEPQTHSSWEEATILVKRPSQIDADSPCANVRPEDDTIITKLPAGQHSVLVRPTVCLEKNKETEIRIFLGKQDGHTFNSRATVLIDSIVLIPSFDDLPFLKNGSSGREEFDRYNCGDSYYYDLNRDNIPEVCKKYHSNIGFYIRNGSEPCQCDPSGSKSHQCNPFTGNCQCVENIVGVRCDRCAPGTYGFSKFGCKRCDCNSIGSLDNFCDAASGQCKCRANTYGRACDLCQPGYFNFPNCQQCDCNGHAVECDDKTGACKECQENTEGHRCERCIEGYYGDPRLGIDIPCRLCPCPGVKGDSNKNSHADRCELDSETKDVVCDCKEGYAGLLCDVCADNYYGDPMKGTCEKCECNDNTDITKPGNCDPYTGKCMQCLHNTAGEHCEICEEGYYGNALEKACYKCNCSVLGSNFTQGNCDGVTGQCPCFNNVMGINCDQCTENHWRIALGTGCDPCECDPVGSLSPQCNPYIGKCDCKPGHGGRQCDQCQENHWGDPNVECYECDCDIYGSVSQQCSRENGSCFCKPGIGGYKCDMCARGYLGEAPECNACGDCFDNWDRIIGDLRIQTEYAIGNASKIKVVGATGAYTRDFEEMTKKLSDVETTLESAKQGNSTVRELLSNVTNLQNKLNEADKKVKDSNDNLNAITSKINLGNVTLDGLRTRINALKSKTFELGNNATKLQEANLEGALNLTREAKDRAVKVADEVESVQTIIANTDRQIKNTDRLIEMQYASFNNTQNENDKELGRLRQQLSELEMQLPKINEKMCGQESDSCDICGGAGCGKCGGISCDQGATTKAEQALDFANKTEHRIKEHELTAEDLLRSVSQVKQDTVAVRSRAKDLFNRATDFKASAERATNESQEITAELKEFLSKTYNTPEEVRQLATEILNLSISIEPKEITELSQRINSTVSQLTNIENIIAETKPDLDRAKTLKQNATNVNQAANLTLEMANKVLEALDEAQAAQDAAENAIDKANRDIEAAKADLLPIASETEQAQKKANETMDDVEGLRSRLSDLQKNILKIESDAEQVKQEANDVVNKAEGAEQKARQLRQDFKQTNISLAERSSQTSSSRERAQLLLNRATKLASDTQSQLKLLANMEELYNDHNEQLNDLEKEIGELNTKMNYYLSEITKRSDYYRWLYLEPILYNDDGDLGIKFRRVDHLFKQVARIIEADSRLSSLVQSTRLQPMLDAISEQLNACQSALNQYMEEKRSIFPRLYFLSDDDLLELLGQARGGARGREEVMQTHLKKLFPGITGVRLGPEGVTVTALCSQFGEIFTLDQSVDVDCSVEVWLNKLEQEIRSSLKNLTLRCLVANSLPHQDPLSLPTQILCLLQNIRFTEQAESAIVTKELRKLKDNIEKENLYYATAEVDNEKEKYKRQALILQCAYYIAVVEGLIEQNVVNTGDWLWQKQLRFYLVNKVEVVAKMGLAEISYSYEYLGVNTGQFVRTDTTDESFLILTQALHLGFVGNPFGPAGTGKTESVKALGSLVGRLVLVFNCDEAMDADCLARLLSGVARCGAWGCFDEFNRLEAGALAAAAHQLTGLLAALTARDTHVVLQGREVPLSLWCGVAVTLNPAGRGYGGRRELPAALQAALRPLALRPPPPALLAARLLAASVPCRDPDHYRILGEDLDSVFELAGTLLSSQRHYDWGLRALKAAVSSCGAALVTEEEEGDVGLCRRRAALRRALRLNNLSKLTPDDAERFESILSLVFADVPEERQDIDPVQASLGDAVKRLGLVRDDLQIQKCMELYEQMQQRMGVVIVGPPGSGKTTIRRLLKAALVHQGCNIVEYIIHPKALERGWLFGGPGAGSGGGPVARGTCFGVLHTVALQATAQPEGVWSWIVCDGDLDPDWVEALNSALDDNRLLSLPSGERVCLRAGVSFVFETDGLRAASPATLTRLAPILLSEESDCSQQILDTWIQRSEFDNEPIRDSLPMVREVIQEVLTWMRTRSADLVVKHGRVAIVRQIISQFEYLIGETVISGDWAVRVAVSRAVTGVIKQKAIGHLYRVMQLPPAAPPAGSSPESPRGPRLQGAGAVLRAALLHSHALLLGPRASGKNILAEYVVRDTFATVVVVDCTPVTEPSDIIAELKRRSLVCGASSGTGAGGVRGAGAAGRACLLLRGLHRATRDSWGSVRVHDFLLQLIQEGGFWCVEEGGPQWHCVSRVTLLATTASVPRLSPRLAAALLPVVITEPDADELLDLSESYLRDSITGNVSDNDITNLVSDMIPLYKEVCETFDSQPHYTWNCSHLRQWCENIKLYYSTTAADVLRGIKAEAALIFRERLITEEERLQYDTIAQRHLGGDNTHMYYIPKIRNDGVYLEAIERPEWYHHTHKMINQCLSDNERALGDVAVEACEELAAWTLATAVALSGCVATCVASEGAGRRAGAALAAAALGATTHTLTHERHLHAVLHDALSSAASSRSLVVICGAACSCLVLGSLEALLKATSLHSLPATMVPSTGNNTPSLSNMKRNLGIMICLDKDQENIKALLEEFPLLHSSSRLCWLEGWSLDTLKSMPSLVVRRLMKEDVQVMNRDEIKTVPVDGFLAIYRTIEEEWLRAPVRYLYFIKAYYHVLSTKRSALLQRQNMLTAGVEALSVARRSVATLRGEAEQQERALCVERQAAADAVQQMGATVRAATHRKEDMQRLKDDIQAENEKLQLRKKEIEAELASVEPVVAAARAAVGDIRPEALSEVGLRAFIDDNEQVRSLRAPPEVVRDVLEGVLRLMGIADTSWHSMKNFLSKRGVKEDIRHLDAADISPDAVATVSRLVDRRATSFAAESARRASAAVAPLASWVRANLEHARALARVRPLQDQQRQLHEKLRHAEEEVAALSSGLESVEGRVAELQNQLGQHAHEAAALEHRLQLATQTLHNAASLLEQLGAEAATWDDDLQNISKEILDLNQRSLLAAGYLIFLPHLTEQQATERLTRWSALIGFEDDNFSVMSFLSSPEEQLRWQAEGLPSDLSAAKNALVLHQFLSGVGLRPLVVDPAGEARFWLRGLSSVSLETVSGGGRELGIVVQQVQRRGQAGRALLVTEADQLEGWWWEAPGVARAVLLTGDPALLNRLPTRLRATLAPLLFTSRLDALLDQLVNYAIEKRSPEMFDKWKEIKVTSATLQKQQHELQETLLEELCVSRDILQDSRLASCLERARAAAERAEAVQREREALEQSVAVGAASWRGAALRAARLVLAVRHLAARRPLLALSATALRETFLDALNKDLDDTNKEQATKHFVKKTLERVMLGVHRRERCAVMMHLMKQVYEDLLQDKLWQLLINNFNMDVRDDNLIEDLEKKYTWMSRDCARKVAQIKMLDENLFARLSLEEWQGAGDKHVLETGSLTAGERTLATAAVNPAALHQAVVQWIDGLLESSSVQDGEPVSRALRCTGPTRPALLLAPDAGQHVAAAAATRGQTVTTVGVDEGPAAWEEGLQRAGDGGWLAITVGASPFPRDLILFVESIAERVASDFNHEFRLWILAEEREIPNALISACVTVILEPAEGVRRAACSTLSSWSGPCVSGEAARLAAGLALLHAIVTERRAYIPIGWSRWYMWGWGEWRACQSALQSSGPAARPLCVSLYLSRVSARADRALLFALEARCLSAALPARLPSTTTLQEYMCSLESLPSSDTAGLLQLPLNCRAARLQRDANLLLDGLREFNSASFVEKDDASFSTKILQSLWKKMMAGSPLLRPDFHVQNRVGWWGGVVCAEVRDAHCAARAVHASLATAPTFGPLTQTPEYWQLVWTGPSSPHAYLLEFCERARAAHDRMLQDCPEDYMPGEVDLRSFLRPARVLAVLRARRAARLRCSPRALLLTATWDCATAPDGSDSVCVRGLCLSGGEWRAGSPAGTQAGGAVVAASADSPPLSAAPTILLRYVRRAEGTDESSRDPQGTSIPLYESPRREEELCCIRAPLGPTLSAHDAALHAVALLVAPRD